MANSAAKITVVARLIAEAMAAREREIQRANEVFDLVVSGLQRNAGLSDGELRLAVAEALKPVLFDCDHCEGDVVMTVGRGRSYDFRSGIMREIPEDFATAMCQSCGRSYLTSDEAGRLERMFAAEHEVTDGQR